MYEECKDCLLSSQMKKAVKQFGEKRAEVFKAEAVKLAENAPSEYCAPLLMRDFDALARKLFGQGLDYSAEKQQFNAAMLAIEDELCNKTAAAEDPVKEAVKLAMAANFIDFTKISAFDNGAVTAVLQAAERATPDEATLKKLKKELSKAKTLVYLHDNCGEIVLDKILIRVIKQKYPRVTVFSVVRGEAVINDVTKEDAVQTGLSKYSIVTENGANIPGTYLKEINAFTKQLLNEADVIISKGLGNLETLGGEGYSVYYMLMAKCAHMAERFSVNLMDTVLYKE